MHVTRFKYFGACEGANSITSNAITTTGESRLYRMFELWNGYINVTKNLYLHKVIVEKIVNIRLRQNNIILKLPPLLPPYD